MTAKIKLNAASGGGSFSLQAPSSSSNNRVIALPDIADGTLLTSQSTLDSTKLSPAISGGLEMADQWRITSGFSFSSLTVMTANWERVDTNGYGQLGTGMTESSGIFTFPSTGIYHIDFRASGSVVNVTNHVGAIIRATTDGSNFSTAAAQYGSSPSANYNSGQSTQHIFDVTNTSTHKVCFAGEAGSTVAYDGSSSLSYTNVVFTKLGDT